MIQEGRGLLADLASQLLAMCRYFRYSTAPKITQDPYLQTIWIPSYKHAHTHVHIDTHNLKSETVQLILNSADSNILLW